MRRSHGFTIIELLFALILIAAIATIAVVEKNNIDSSNRDRERKTSINAIYYGLKEGYFKEHKNYPTSVSSKNLPFINPASFKDPSGKSIGDPKSDYHYEAINCSDGKCKEFRLSAILEQESDYKKSSE